MKLLISFLVIFPGIVFGQYGEKLWWEKAGFYQIYPRSYKDSNGDGIGDLKGITEKLSYLKEIGMKAFWLSPIFKSPMADFGYDISDFRDIHPEFGTMADFENLVAQAKLLGLKVILDFVPNHSSDEHVWFGKSVRREEGYEDYYVWHSGKVNPEDPTGRPLEPSNWRQAFRGSAWEWNEERGQYYLHQFHRKQPDLNYRNEKVVQEMKDVLTFWLDKGVDGFRIDAVPWCFEIKIDENGNCPDEPLSGYTDDPEESSYLLHTYTQDQPETVEMVYQWRELMDKYQAQHGGETRVLMTESWSDLEHVLPYYQSNIGRQGAHMPFNFRLIMDLNKNSNAKDFKNSIDSWLVNVPNGHTPNWVLGNHDKSRYGSRMGADKRDMMVMIEMTLPGASVTYQGEEIGMLDVFISWEETVDPSACQSTPEKYQESTRDPNRTPFQWDDSKNAGFSNGTKTWLPIAENYKEVNVKVEEAAETSYLKIFKDLLTLRAGKTFMYGSVKTVAVNNNVFAIVREMKNSDTFITLANLGTAEETVDVSKLTKDTLPLILVFEIVSLNSNHKKGETVSTNAVKIQQMETLVLKAQGNVVFTLLGSLCESWFN